MVTPTKAPPRMARRSEYTVRSGIMRIRATIRGSTRKSMGGMPMVTSASISSFTRMVPSWAAKAAPVRPAMMMPVIRQPISRVAPMATRSAT